MSVGLLYYQLNQYMDCLDGFSRSIKLNPSEPLVWRNLGILVSSTLTGGHRTVLLICSSSTTPVTTKE